jgi:hypothetical protein
MKIEIKLLTAFSSKLYHLKHLRFLISELKYFYKTHIIYFEKRFLKRFKKNRKKRIQRLLNKS